VKYFARARFVPLLGAVLALPVILVAFACSSNESKTVSTDQWVSDLCTSSNKFGDVQNKEGDKLAAAFDVSDPKAQKKTLQDLLGEFNAAAKTYRTEFDKLGTPDVKSGKQIHELWVTEFDANQKNVDDIRKKVDKLDPNSKSFQEDLGAILGESNDTDFRSKLAAVDGSQPIIDAIDKDSGCAAVVFSGNSDSSGSGSATAVASGTAQAQTTAAPGASKNDKWVIGLCTAAQSYVDDLTELSDNLDVDQNDLKALKDTMVKFLQDAQGRTKTFKSDIDKLGNPDVKDGAKIEADMSSAANNVVTIFDKAVRDAKALDANNPATLVSGLETLGQSLSDASDDVSNAFGDIDTKYDTTALTKIAGGVPECSGLF
jgi:hypothetical protein